MKLKSTPLLLLLPALMLLLVACDEKSQRDAPPRGDLSPTDIELDSAMKEELLALANNRDAWFLASDVTTDSLLAYPSDSVLSLDRTLSTPEKET